jgi:hypothetical protein
MRSQRRSWKLVSSIPRTPMMHIGCVGAQRTFAHSRRSDPNLGSKKQKSVESTPYELSVLVSFINPPGHAERGAADLTMNVSRTLRPQAETVVPPWPPSRVVRVTETCCFLSPSPSRIHFQDTAARWPAHSGVRSAVQSNPMLCRLLRPHGPARWLRLHRGARGIDS